MAASQIFEQLSFAQRKLGLGSAALPAAWTSSRRSSPVASPRGVVEFSNVLPDEESSDDSDPLPPPLAQVNKLPLTAATGAHDASAPVTGQRTPASNPATARSGGSGGSAGDNHDDDSHSMFDVSELQELKRRLQEKKERAKGIVVTSITMLNDSDAESDDDGSSDDEKASNRKSKSNKKKTASGRSSSKSKNLSLRRRKKTSDESGAGVAAAAVAAVAAAQQQQQPPPPGSQPPPPTELPPDDSPRRTTSTHNRPSAAATARGRKVRTLPRNARTTTPKDADGSSDDGQQSSDEAADAAPMSASPARASDDDVWTKLIAMEKEKQLKREKRKKSSDVTNAGGNDAGTADEDEQEEAKAGGSRRRNRRSKAPASRILPPSADDAASAPKFTEVFAVVDSSPEASPRDKLASMGFVADEASNDDADKFGAFFQEEPEAAESRGVQFGSDVKGDATGSPSATQTRSRSKSVSVSERMRALQPVTLGAIKEKQLGKATKADADADAGVAAVVSAAVAATAASHEASVVSPVATAANSAASASAAAAAAAAAAAKTASAARPKVCQHCVAMAVATAGKVAARVITPDGVELFLCKPCAIDFQKRDGQPPVNASAVLPLPASLSTSSVRAASPTPTAATAASRLSTSGHAPGAAASAVAAAAAGGGASPNASLASLAEEGGRFSFRGIKNRFSGRYKLQRDAEGNVITIDKAGVVGAGADMGGKTPDSPMARSSQVAHSSLTAAGVTGALRDSDKEPRSATGGRGGGGGGGGGGEDDEENSDRETAEAMAASNRLRRELAQVQTKTRIGYDIGRRTDDIVVVLDPGSATTKIGFSGEAAPRAVLPTWVRYMEAPRRPAGGGSSGLFSQPVIPVAEGTLPDRPGFIGEDASVPKLRSTWKHPVERGVVRDWDEMEKIFEYSFDYELKADPEDHPVMLTDGSPLSDRLQRERAMQIMFETFNVPSAYLALQSAMSLLACGELTGLAVTVGDGVTCAVPIYEGFPIRHAIHTLDRAGADLTTHLVELVNDSMQATEDWAKLAPGETEQLLFDSTSHSDRYQFEQIKRKYCYVARQTVAAEERLASESRYKYEKQWTTADGRRVPLLHERYLACEPIFAPSLIGGAEMHWIDEAGGTLERRHVNCEGIHRLAYASVRKCDKAIRKTLLQNVYMAGGSSRIDGMTERMADELKSLLVGTHLAKAKVSVGGGKASDQFSEWLGASMFASLSAFQGSAISRDEYLDVGPAVVHRRCV
jgi:actin-related protein